MGHTLTMVPRHTGCHTSGMDSGKPQGWHADPFGLHEARYFSAGHPTKLVRDGGTECYDEPPPESWPPPEPDRHTDAPAWQADAPTWQAGLSAEPSETPGDLEDILTEPPEAQWNADYAPPPKRPWAAFAAAAVIIGGTIAGLISLTHEGSAAASGDAAGAPAAFVAGSARQTVAQKTVAIAMSGTVQSSGNSTAQLDGNGTVDFSTHSMAVTFSYSFSGHSFAERMIMTGGNDYLALSIDGRGLASDGRHWARWANTESLPASIKDLDLSSALSALEQPGASVTALGTRTIGGRNCYGYAVSPARQADDPQSATTVWAASDQLLCQLSVVVRQSSSAGSLAAGGQLVMDFTHYGAPVRITAPAQSDTESGPRWLAGLGNRASAT
jgi:hypothetical protein